MAKIEGTFMTSLVIDAGKEDLFQALAEELEIGYLFEDYRDMYYKLVMDTNGTSSTPYIVRMENKSYHGSPSYDETSRSEISMETYRCAATMQELRDAMKAWTHSQSGT